MTIAKAKMFWPLIITTANRVVPYKFSGTDHTVNIATGTYLSAAALAAAIQTAIIAGGVLTHMAVTVDSTGHFVFSDVTDGAFILRWSLTTNSCYLLLGFTAADTTSATSQTSTNQHQNGWYAPLATSIDSLPIRDRKADVVTLTMAGQTKYITENELLRRNLQFSFLSPEYTYKQYESSVNTAIERLWESGRSQFRFWPDGTVEGTYNDYTLGPEAIKEFAPMRQYPKKALYQIKLDLLGYVA